MKDQDAFEIDFFQLKPYYTGIDLLPRTVRIVEVVNFCLIMATGFAPASFTSLKIKDNGMGLVIPLGFHLQNTRGRNRSM
ncbi:unnamed protein product [Lactuca virosa]|uniref:Uncharacterized protein n=1 Tax=Lactuca virosa TaxID=75947 RepID=A0AAU9MCM1_9ASTR|nr:unnamed protein product [Lactuca virosa]